MAKNQNAVGPIDVDAERAVAAVVAANPALLDDVTDHLSDDSFHDPAARALFQTVLNLEAAGQPIDLITIGNEARKLNTLTLIGDTEGIDAALQMAPGHVAHLSTYRDIVVEKARLRKAIDAGRMICDAAMLPSADAYEVTELAEETVFALNAKQQSNSLIWMREAMPQVLDDITRSRASALAGHSTGLTELDKMTGGFQPGQLWIVAARPGVGKSALALQMARTVAETTGLAVPFLSYEMSVSELGLRMLAGALSLSMTDLRDGNLPAGAERDLGDAAARLSELPVLIDDNPPATIAGVRSQMRRLARRTELGAIFVDYLQLLEGSRRRDANRNEEVSEISRGLKRLSAELGVPVIALSQLNRQVEMRGGAKRPQLSDLRDSGAVEQDANVITFLYREALVNHQADPRLAEVIVAKQRSGPTGSVHVDFDGPSARFSDTSRRPLGVGAGHSPSFGGDDNPF